MLDEIIICIIIPLIFFSLILKKDARYITRFLCIGTIACYAAYLLNTQILTYTGYTYFYLTTTIAPIIEELLKFIPIILLFLLSKDDTEKIFAAAFALGVGFAITENLYMLAENAEGAYTQWLILRGVSTGLMHPMSASIIAMGISKTMKHPELTFVGIIAILFLAMIYHGFYNCLVNNDGIMRYIGVTVPVITYAIIFLINRKDDVKLLLAS